MIPPGTVKHVNNEYFKRVSGQPVVWFFLGMSLAPSHAFYGRHSTEMHQKQRSCKRPVPTGGGVGWLAPFVLVQFDPPPQSWSPSLFTFPGFLGVGQGPFPDTGPPFWSTAGNGWHVGPTAQMELLSGGKDVGYLRKPLTTLFDASNKMPQEDGRGFK